MKDCLQHYGILGMKWGVRRYQNKDGTLTKEGKERYTTIYENDFIRKNHESAERKENKERLDKLLNRKDEDSNDLLTKKDEAVDAYAELDKAFIAYLDRARKDGHKEGFDGDGTEAHWKLKELYPDYKKISDRATQATVKYVNKLLDLSEKGYFDDAIRGTVDFKDAYSIDGKAYTAALILSIGDSRDSSFVPFSDFFTSFSDNKTGDTYRSVNRWEI